MKLKHVFCQFCGRNPTVTEFKNNKTCCICWAERSTDTPEGKRTVALRRSPDPDTNACHCGNFKTRAMRECRECRVSRMDEKARDKWLAKWCLECGSRKAAGACIDCLIPLRDPRHDPGSPEDMKADVDAWLMVYTPNAYGWPDADG